MTPKYLQVLISAASKEQADEILDSLLNKKLVAGGLILKGPAKFWWKGKIVASEYYNISSFTVDKHKETIIAAVKKVSIEEVPIITFTQFQGNKELIKWIEESVS